MQGGLTDLWLDDPYVLAAKKLLQWATEENEKGGVYPVSSLFPAEMYQTSPVLPESQVGDRLDLQCNYCVCLHAVPTGFWHWSFLPITAL